MKKGFVHTVFFWLKNPENQEDRQQFLQGLNDLAKIDLIQNAYVGEAAATNREVIDNSYTFGITFIFKNKADQDIYQDHPDHHVFINRCSQYWEKVQVYDLEA